ncbi:MAG: polysaccharide biosynthesis protein [Thermoleophilia bacterium]
MTSTRSSLQFPAPPWRNFSEFGRFVPAQENRPGHSGPFSHDESALYRIHEKLSQHYFQKHILCIADIKSESKMEYLFRQHRPDLVFHAAAYKHVPLMELQPDIDVVFTGLRPGEKLHEQLIDTHESRTSTDHSMIYQVSAMDSQPSILADLPGLFNEAKSHDGDSIKAFLEKWIPSYSPFDMRLVGSINTRDQKAADGTSTASSVIETIGYRWNDEETSSGSGGITYRSVQHDPDSD